MRRAWLLLAGLTLAAATNLDTLKAVDAFRHPWPAYQVEVLIEVKGQSQRWKVTSADSRNVRVEGLSPKEKGRTVLILGDNMWLLLPTAKRPVKVTPQQRLLGPAAGGDLARASFSEDFEITQRQETTLEDHPALRLDLAAKTPANSYRTAVLWVAPADHRPLKAEFRLASGKLARTLIFGAVQEAKGKRVLTGMAIEEPSGARSDLHFEAWSPAQPDPELFKLP